MKCIIVDDDKLARVHLEGLCAKIDDLEVQAIFESGINALKWLKDHTTDVILLDIQMPDLTGLDLVKNVEKLPQIVFITSHTEHALEAFEHQVTDFVPKPVQFMRLHKAISRVREILENVKQEDQNGIFIRVDGKYVQLDLDDVLYIESYGDYVKFLTSKKTFVVHSTLKNIEDKIQSSKFMKVHRSYIVNLSKVADIEESNLLIGEKVIPISRSHRADLMSRIRTI